MKECSSRHPDTDLLVSEMRCFEVILLVHHETLSLTQYHDTRTKTPHQIKSKALWKAYFDRS
jgi:hypothetical protein